MDISMAAISSVALFVVQASLKATLLVALVLLAQKVFGKLLSARARYLLWFTVVVSLVTPVGFETGLHSALLPASPVMPDSLVPIAASDSPAASTPTGSAQRTSAPPRLSAPATSAPMESAAMTETFPSLALAWLPSLWLAGVLVVLGAIAVSGFRFARMVRRATPAPAAVQDFLDDCMRRTACSARVRLLHSTEVDAPMIAGQFRPVLLLPQGLEHQVSRDELRHVFIHELMHLQRGDILSNWIVALVQALHWFNPAVWFAFFCMRQDRELACDAATLQHLAPADHAAYGHTLIRLNDALQHSSTPPLALGMLDSSSHLEKRILMLVHSSRSRKLQSRAASLLFLPLAALAFSQPAVRAVEPAAAVAPAEPVVAADMPEPVSAEPAQIAVDSRSAEQAQPVAESAPLAPEVFEEITPAAEPATPALGEPARSLGRVTPDPLILARLSEDPVSVPLIIASAAAATRRPAAEPDPDLVEEILQLADSVTAATLDGVRFVAELDAAAAECNAKGDGFFAMLSRPCAKTRRALNRGHVLLFGYQCYLLSARQENLVDRYRQATNGEPGASSLDSALRSNAANLGSFCSKETYAQRYPAFASLVAEAESLEHFKPGRRTLNTAIALTNRSRLEGGAWANATSWYEIGMGQGGGMDGSTGAYGGPGPTGGDSGSGGGGGDSGGAAAPAP
jgi:beta-lactamase regulating signal transducer with metallopeptidase domain